MAGYSSTTIVGHVGRAPEMRYTPNGKAVTSFSVAVTVRKDAEPEWYEVSCWEKLAETANNYVAKGKQVMIEGRINLHTWKDPKTGEMRAKLQLTASRLLLLGSKGDGNGGGSSPSPSSDNLDEMAW